MLEETYRAEARHFWFRGFRRFIRPLLTQATAGLSHPDCLTAAPAPAPISCSCASSAPRSAWTSRGAAWSSRTATGVQRLARATVAQLPFLAGTIDVAVSFDVLYCLADDEEARAIAEMHRVLRPGGAIIVNAAALDMLKGDHSVLVSEVRRYTRRRLADKLKAAGFRVERITYTNASIFP